MSDIIAVSVESESEQRELQTILLNNHVSGQLVARINPDHQLRQVLGRDAIVGAAKKSAQVALQYAPQARYAIGLQRGIVMSPAGTFVICAAVLRLVSGREVIGWSDPRVLPEAVAQTVDNGGDFFRALQSYRQHWHIADPFTLVDLEELLTCHQARAEAMQFALTEINS